MTPVLPLTACRPGAPAQTALGHAPGSRGRVLLSGRVGLRLLGSMMFLLQALPGSRELRRWQMNALHPDHRDATHVGSLRAPHGTR